MKKFCSLMLIMSMCLGFQTSFAQEVENQPKEDVIELKEEDMVLSMSLEDAIKTALENSKTVEIADLNIGLKEVELSEARHIEDKYDDLVDFVKYYPDAAKASGKDRLIGSDDGIMLDANMASKKATRELQDAELSKKATIKKLEYDVTKAYYGLLMTRTNLEIAQNNNENVKRNTGITRTKFELGVASKSDLLFAEIALDEAKSSFEDAKTEEKNVSRKFNMALDLPLEKKVNLTSVFTEEEKEFDIQSDIEKAYETRADYVAKKNMYELAKLDIETNIAKYPSNTFVYKKKARNMMMAETGYNAMEKYVEFDIKDKYDTMEKAKTQIEISKGIVQKAKEGLRLRELSYESGLGTLTEVKDATNDLYKAELGLSKAVNDYNLAIIEYEKAISVGGTN